MGTANRHSETGRQGPTKGATEDVPGLIAEGFAWWFLPNFQVQYTDIFPNSKEAP